MKTILVTISLLSICLFLCCKNANTNHDATHEEHSTTTNHGPLTGEQVLDNLKAGNQNFVTNSSTVNFDHGHNYNFHDQLDHTKTEQHPTAFILSCMDSRVPPEIVFDQGIGALFIDRVAGNVEDAYILGSLEYAVNVKGVKLVIIMGHTNCGAINGAFSGVDSSNTELIRLLSHVKEGYIANDTPPYDASAKHNVVVTMNHILEQSKSIKAKVDAHEIIMTGAMYDVATGKVDWDYSKW